MSDTVYSRWLAHCAATGLDPTGRRKRNGRMNQWERRAAKGALMAGRVSVQCHYCGVWLSRHTVTLDHIVPRSRGGRDELSNFLLCCSDCNQSKGAKAYQDYVSKVAA